MFVRTKSMLQISRETTMNSSYGPDPWDFDDWTHLHQHSQPWDFLQQAAEYSFGQDFPSQLSEQSFTSNLGIVSDGNSVQSSQTVHKRPSAHNLDEHAKETQDVAPSPPDARLGRRNRRSRPIDAEWEKHKEAIKLHYITYNNTLAKTISYMKNQGFHASTKMYKQRFRYWGFVKNLKRDEALQICHDPEREGLDLSEAAESRMIPEERLQRSIDRHLKANESKLDTAESTDIPAPTVRSSSITSLASPNALEMTGSKVGEETTQSNEFWDWCETNAVKRDACLKIREVVEQYFIKAMQLHAAGDLKEAEHPLRVALSLCHSGLPIADTFSFQISHRLALLLAGLHDVERSKKVMKWVLVRQKELPCLGNWGLGHPNTVKSISEVVQSFFFLGAYCEATILLENYLVLIEQSLDERRQETPCYRSDLEREQFMNASWSRDVYPLAPLIRKWRLQYKLLVSHRSRRIGSLILKIWCVLLRMCELEFQPHPELAVAEDGMHSVIEQFREGGNQLEPELLDLARTIGRFYFRCNGFGACYTDLSELAATLEDWGDSEDNLEQDRANISISVITAYAHQEYNRDGGSWEAAKPWVEHAWRLAAKPSGNRSSIKETLRRMLLSDEMTMSQEDIERWLSK